MLDTSNEHQYVELGLLIFGCPVILGGKNNTSRLVGKLDLYKITSLHIIIITKITRLLLLVRVLLLLVRALLLLVGFLLLLMSFLLLPVRNDGSMLFFEK
jgi:hypothetical protein